MIKERSEAFNVAAGSKAGTTGDSEKNGAKGNSSSKATLVLLSDAKFSTSSTENKPKPAIPLAGAQKIKKISK